MRDFLQESPSRTITAAQAVFKNRLIWSSERILLSNFVSPSRVISISVYFAIGDSSFGKVLQDNCKSVYGESTRSLREKHRGSIQEEDPFSWCVGETPPVVNIQREAQDNLVPAGDRSVVMMHIIKLTSFLTRFNSVNHRIFKFEICFRS